MSYRESLDYLYGLQRFGIKLGLENIRALLDRLHHPETSFFCIHIAGTNGKGSTAAMLASILQAGGHRVGLYTSPHLHSFAERIRVNGEEIPEAEVVRFTDRIREAAGEIPSTFFEFTTAMALAWFYEQQVEIAIMETGMGGRLDATNAIDYGLTILTPIAIDHAAYLGDSLAAIAAEKAAVIRQGTPVISARQEPEAAAVIETHALERTVPLIVAGRDVHLAADGERISFMGEDRTITGLTLPLAGEYQRENLTLVLAAIEQLERAGLVRLTDETIRHGLAEARWPGRLEWIAGAPRLLLDGAHNLHGASGLARYLASIGIRPVWLAGFKNDKDVAAMIATIEPHVAEIVAVPPPIDDAVTPQDIARCVTGSPVTLADDFRAGLDLSCKKAGAEGVVLVAGSLFLVGAVRGCKLGEEPR